MAILTYNQGSNIRDGQVSEVHIGGSPHVLIAHDDHAGGQVATHSHNKEEAVNNCQREKSCPVNMGVTKCVFNVGC